MFSKHLGGNRRWVPLECWIIMEICHWKGTSQCSVVNYTACQVRTFWSPFILWSRPPAGKSKTSTSFLYWRQITRKCFHVPESFPGCVFVFLLFYETYNFFSAVSVNLFVKPHNVVASLFSLWDSSSSGSQNSLSESSSSLFVFCSNN